MRQILQMISKVKYFILLALGYYFIHQGDVLAKFQMKRTSFSEHMEPISELPTLLTKVIYNDNRTWTYGKDFTIVYGKLKSDSQISSTLTFGENVVDGSLNLYFENVVPLKEFCIRISFINDFSLTDIIIIV